MAVCASRETSTSAEEDRYKYSPISAPGEIRCLILDCGSGDEPLTCELHHSNLEEGPVFEAISYVWGSSVKDHSILCNGRRLDITANLHQYLRQNRRSTETRVLWADSICIDQSSNAERAHQVRLMGQIYSRAKRVLITLGVDELSDTHAEDAAAVIHSTNKMVLETLAGLDGGWDTFPYVDDNHPLLSDPRWLSVGYLVYHPWFSRGWVVQEAALAAEAWLLWGHTEIHWFDLMRSYIWLLRRADSIRARFGIYLVGPLHMALFIQLHFHDESKAFFYKTVIHPSQCPGSLGRCQTPQIDRRQRPYLCLPCSPSNGQPPQGSGYQLREINL